MKRNEVKAERFLRLPEVKKLTGLSRSSLYAAMEQGAFPASLKIGLRAIAWRESEVEAWQRLVIEQNGAVI